MMNIQVFADVKQCGPVKFHQRPCVTQRKIYMPVLFSVCMLDIHNFCIKKRNFIWLLPP